MADHLVAPTIYRQGGLFWGGQAYPTVMIVCRNCGHTVYLNAVVMGLIQPKKKTGVEEESKEKEDTDGS